MSSQSKRRAESEEVSHKKKPRKGEDGDDFNQDEDDGLDVENGDVGALDKDNIIPTDRRTRGRRVDDTKVGLGDDNGFEAGEEVSKEKKGAPAGPQTGSPQRELAVEEDEEEEDDEEEGEYGEDEYDTEEYEEDEEE